VDSRCSERSRRVRRPSKIGRRYGTPPRARVFEIIKRKSYGEKRIVLASGKESDFYFDMKPTMFDPEALALLPELVLEKLKGVEFDCIGGLEMGAVPLISPVMMHALVKHGREIPGFFVRQKAKTHGTKRLIEGSDVKGRKAVILDDVTTTGGSAMQAVQEVRNAGGEVVMVLSIVDREEGAAELYAEQGIPFGSVYTASEFRGAR
jgi:orotate phosphoribosyltransferase